MAVVVPARDEEERLPLLLADLPASSRHPLRIVVVDDDSSDATFDLAVDAGVEAVRTRPLPTGWAGKPWACHRGVAHLADEPDDTVLVLLDADVRVDPGAIDALVHERGVRGGVVSVAPHHEVPTIAEQANLLFNLVQVMGIGAGTRSPRGVFGPVVCLTLGDLRLVGDHASVRDEVVEDLVLARRLRRHGVALHTFVGGFFRIRMYPAGLRSLGRGWSKNIVTGARLTPLRRRLLVAWWIAALTAITFDLAVALLTSTGRSAAITAHLLAVATLLAPTRRVGDFRRSTVVLFPVPLAVFLGVFASSLRLTLLNRSVAWSGRSIPIPRTRGRTRRTVPGPSTIDDRRR